MYTCTDDDCIRTGNQDIYICIYKPYTGSRYEKLTSLQQREHQNRTHIFVVEEHNGTDVNTVKCTRSKSQIKHGHQKPEVEMKLLYKISTKF